MLTIFTVPHWLYPKPITVLFAVVVRTLAHLIVREFAGHTGHLPNTLPQKSSQNDQGSHRPAHTLFTLLPSGRRHQSIRMRTRRLKDQDQNEPTLIHSTS